MPELERRGDGKHQVRKKRNMKTTKTVIKAVATPTTHINYGNVSISLKLFHVSTDGKAHLISFGEAKSLNFSSREYNMVRKMVSAAIDKAVKADDMSLSFQPHRKKTAEYGTWEESAKARFSWDETSPLSLAMQAVRQNRDAALLVTKMGEILPEKGDTETPMRAHGLDWKSLQVAAVNAGAALVDFKSRPFRDQFPELVRTYDGWEHMTLNEWLELVATEKRINQAAIDRALALKAEMDASKSCVNPEAKVSSEARKATKVKLELMEKEETPLIDSLVESLHAIERKVVANLAKQKEAVGVEALDRLKKSMKTLERKQLKISRAIHVENEIARIK